MRRNLLLVVALLALSGLMAAMAVSEAQVRNKMSFSVVHTQDALIALEGGDHAAIKYGGSAKKLEIDFNVGYNGQSFGVQQDSKYTWNDLFKVTNNTEKPVKVTVELNPKTGAKGMRILAKTQGDSNWTQLTGNNGDVVTFYLWPGDHEWICMQLKDWDFDKEGGSTFNKKVSDYNFMLLVTAEAEDIIG